VLFLNQNHYIHICYAPGRGSNNQVEFITLKTLLSVAQEKGVKKFQIMGDSKLVVDWACKKEKMENVGQGFLLRDLEFQIRSFDWLSFHHIYRELNIKADSLSKEALMLLKGAFGYYKFVNGEEKEAM
jgi:ribonuclease HI